MSENKIFKEFQERVIDSDPATLIREGLKIFSEICDRSIRDVRRIMLVRIQHP